MANNRGQFQKGKPRANGAGRKKGVPNKATADIKALAGQHGKKAIDKLVELMDSPEQEIALKAARELLDRAYGKPAQALVGDPEKPLEHNVNVFDEFTRRIIEIGAKLGVR